MNGSSDLPGNPGWLAAWYGSATHRVLELTDERVREREKQRDTHQDKKNPPYKLYFIFIVCHGKKINVS